MGVCRESRMVSERASKRAHVVRDRAKAVVKVRTVKEKHLIKDTN